ncbi:MAG: heme lyase CcmF/NrfE family subunit, partial [Pseudomonadales bacterium]
MVVELGHLSLVIALALAALIAVFGLAGAHFSARRLMGATATLSIGQFVFIALAYAVLTRAFLGDDFSVAYVANNSNSLLPWYYKFSAVWGAHEGSFLLWVLIMSGWTLAVAVLGRSLPESFLARVLGIMGLLNLGFLAFLLFTSNPFERLVPMTPAEGADLNPLLQDFGLIVHPPTLYMGYVGFSVAFAFAVAALLSGRLDAAWARWSRPWSNVAWAFLTLGITLGSWWAYYELGWGGWWFWDPVENASFMPWLAGTALVHSLAVSEKRGTFKSWTLLLAITTFSLSLLGAFIVRSGVLTSVHAFAVDPTRGLFILIFLALVVGGSLTLYALRTATIRSMASYTLASREAFLLVNNILLVIAMAVVLLGTLYPLAYEVV